MMRLRSSARTRCAPSLIRSASSTSSRPSGACCSVTTDAIATRAPCCCCLARQRVQHVVHAELVCLVGQVYREESLRGELPQLAQVVVVVRDGEHPLRGVVVDEEAVEAGRHAAVRVKDRKSTRLNSSHVKISYA